MFRITLREAWEAGSGRAEAEGGCAATAWRAGGRDCGCVGEDKGSPKKSFIYLCSRPTCQAGSWARVRYFHTRKFFTRGHKIKPAPVSVGTKWYLYPHPNGFLAAGMRVICTRCHPYLNGPPSQSLGCHRWPLSQATWKRRGECFHVARKCLALTPAYCLTFH